ncbi:microviridin/marinostatin family tricyclic proteinase inhibitor [Chryseobacterium sp. SSA4.19]|uniref:microviridin/marinostatin family tricyclic proteinase inhibitor n=1 Tax=Chryseobacterium sp. SSA4.19 TaxID=2919915 RepID=UPI001F4E752F|nr:microviridin/marinostatin family tricyclic proteinase inhibitor [Chryseobacterium sp. SSA4.19]MCJ8153160.1 microviridin/marinostatin family tricyclic proteinase inhibitor [Chryseobacterium sp. SSA4.19]
MKNKDSKKKPFFASFLEKQIADPEKVKGGSGDTTTGVLRDNVTSLLVDSVTQPGQDIVSMKYPSDSDEDGTFE